MLYSDLVLCMKQYVWIARGGVNMMIKVREQAGTDVGRKFDQMLWFAVWKKITDTATYPQSFVFSINCIERIEKSGHKPDGANIIDMGKLVVDDVEHPRLLGTHEYDLYLSEIVDMLKNL